MPARDEIDIDAALAIYEGSGFADLAEDDKNRLRAKFRAAIGAGKPLDTVVAEAIKRFAALSPEEQAAMMAEQRQSWVRGMTARCEHGVVDFEQCPDCRAATCEGADDPDERCPRHPRDCICWRAGRGGAR